MMQFLSSVRKLFFELSTMLYDFAKCFCLANDQLDDCLPTPESIPYFVQQRHEVIVLVSAYHAKWTKLGRCTLHFFYRCTLCTFLVGAFRR